MSGVFGNLVTQIRGLVGDAVESLEDPGRTARQILRDLDADIAKADAAMVDVRAEVHQVETRKQKAEADVAKYAAYAERAVGQGKDDLAREALADKRKAQSRKDEAERECAQIKPAQDALQRQIEELRRKRNELANRTETIEARSAVAAATERVGTVLGSVGDSGGVAAFERLEGKVSQQEARAQAAMDVARERGGGDDRYRELDETASSVDDELAALKQKVTATG